MFSVRRISLFLFFVQRNKLVRLKLDPDAIGLSTILEKISRVPVKDCFQDDETIYFVVPPGMVGKAIGKGAVNIKKVQARLNKKIKIVEFNDNCLMFVKKLIYPLKIETVVEEDGAIFIKDSNKKTKSLLIGRGGKNLKLLNRAVQRFFSKEVKIL